MAASRTNNEGDDRRDVSCFVASSADPGTGELDAIIIPFPGNRMFKLTRLIMQTETALSAASNGISRSEAEFLECTYDHPRCRFNIDGFTYVEVSKRDGGYRFVSKFGKRTRVDYRSDEMDQMADFIVAYILERVFEERRRSAAC